ncbi:MAG TPA: citrate lyase holo-[acyl-carrier protein] synthase [Clostridia bacterium]|nr:citrate lyase holo-[acyl-carrier protein] synthase [Clostridia bacterium]
MLSCREQRACRQREMIERHNLPVACFTMNIPGEIKYTPLIEFAFREGIARFEALLPKAIAREIICASTGCEAYFVFNLEAAQVKQAAFSVEEGTQLGRLFDIDVIDRAGKKLSRGTQRRCVVCGGPVTACARSRAHDLAEVLARENALMAEFAAERLASQAYEALLTEVNATPKPGLVDRRNSGAHRDMDLESFHRSADAIRPYFKRMALLALNMFADTRQALMKRLRAEGQDAERAMLAATDGANAHKGAIFSMGLLLAGAGIYLQTGRPALAEAARLADVGLSGALDAAKQAPLTNGDRVYAKTGATGARGEAAGGFPAARKAKETLRGFISEGYSDEDAAALTLPVILEKLEDTNLLHRGREEGLAFAQISAGRINALPVEERLEALLALDDTFIARNLSPGGCADVLALALLMKELEEYIEL